MIFMQKNAAKPSGKEPSLYERLGGVFAIAMVINRFSDEVVKNPKVGQGSKNKALNEWSTKKLDTFAWSQVHANSVGMRRGRRTIEIHSHEPGQTPLGLEKAHAEFHISPEEFDEVAAELGRALDYCKVPTHEKEQVLGAFAAHKNEVNVGFFAMK